MQIGTQEAPSRQSRSDRETGEETLQHIAERAVEKFPESADDAVQCVMRDVRGRDRAALREIMLYKAAAQLVSDVHSNNRHRLEVQAKQKFAKTWKPSTAALQRQEDFVAGRKLSFYSWKLPGSDVLLGDATVVDLESAVSFHAARELGEARRKALYMSLCDVLKKSHKRTVRQAMKDEDIGKVIVDNGLPPEEFAAQ